MMSSVHEAMLLQLQQSVGQLLELTRSQAKRLKRIEERLGTDINIGIGIESSISQIPDFERTTTATLGTKYTNDDFRQTTASSSSSLLGGDGSNSSSPSAGPIFSIPVRAETALIGESEYQLVNGPF